MDPDHTPAAAEDDSDDEDEDFGDSDDDDDESDAECVPRREGAPVQMGHVVIVHQASSPAFQ